MPKTKKTKTESKVKTKTKERKTEKKKRPDKKVEKKAKYFEAVGRRKTAVARVRFWTKGKNEFLINLESFYNNYRFKIK